MGLSEWQCAYCHALIIGYGNGKVVCQQTHQLALTAKSPSKVPTRLTDPHDDRA